DRVRLLETGREIVLPIRPVDPRDLFRGDYARLSYEISTLDSSLLGWSPDAPSRPQDVFVTLEETSSGNWHAVAVSPTLPTNLPANQIAIGGRLNRY
ncbi:GDYXXLXY domain-containing protein, partial [Escherichia coli]|uniref:GDYXXLXY domain-containing protein n=1 Tax=Escherichia coli TaxID=562 RepID=UPI003CE44F8A